MLPGEKALDMTDAHKRLVHRPEADIERVFTPALFATHRRPYREGYSQNSATADCAADW